MGRRLFMDAGQRRQCSAEKAATNLESAAFGRIMGGHCEALLSGETPLRSTTRWASKVPLDIDL